MYTLIRNLSTYTFLHTEIYHVAFLLEKVWTFTAMFTASARAHLSSDVYRSASDFLATVSERTL